MVRKSIATVKADLLNEKDRAFLMYSMIRNKTHTIKEALKWYFSNSESTLLNNETEQRPLS